MHKKIAIKCDSVKTFLHSAPYIEYFYIQKSYSTFRFRCVCTFNVYMLHNCEYDACLQVCMCLCVFVCVCCVCVYVCITRHSNQSVSIMLQYIKNDESIFFPLSAYQSIPLHQQQPLLRRLRYFETAMGILSVIERLREWEG